MDLKKVEKILEKYGIESEETLEDIIELALHAMNVSDVVDDLINTIDLLCDDEDTVKEAQ